MQTANDPVVKLAGTQTPLLEAEQLRVGAYLVGIMLSNVWEVKEINSSAIVIMQKMPAKVCTLPEHKLVKVGQSGEECPCGLRRQPLRDLLPSKPGKARIHVVHTQHRVEPVEHSAIYTALKAGQLQYITVSKGNIWSQPLPLFPELHRVWSLPAPLEAMLSSSAASEPGTDTETSPPW
jgi:hypothetical protein